MTATLPDISKIFGLDGRVALITGGSRGLGFEAARGLAAAGARVILSSRSAESCESAAAAIRNQGGDAVAMPCHVGQVDDIRRLADRVGEEGRLDILINNAGAPLPYTLDTLTEAAFDKSFSVNAKGPLFLIQALRPLLAASPSAAGDSVGGASIINVSTVGAFFGTPTQLGYGASKAALWHMTRTLAKTLAPERVRVNAIAPGPMATLMVTSGGDALMEKSAAGTLQNRVADPAEIIGPMLFLASDAGSFVTGTVVHVDGGWLA
ncbi:MAG: SDR family oxidoreductase [Sphingomonadales bacterium]|nr:MAG: SDR family oxidoreductase [Sphingomonadales bacterium]